MRWGAALSLVFLLTWTTGCQTRIGDLTVGSAKNLPVEFKEIRSGVVGKDCSHMVLVIPIGTINPTIDGAIDDALAQVPGADALTNVSIKNTLLFTLIYNRACVTVEGTAVSTRS